MANKFPKPNQQITLASFKTKIYSKVKNWFFNK